MNDRPPDELPLSQPISDTLIEPLAASPAATPQPRPAKKGPLSWLFGPVLVFLAKAKWLLGLLKFASLAKFGMSALSMAVMIFFEARYYGFPFAVGFVVLILLHELGHGAAMKMVGVEAGMPVFIPFFGAAIALKSMPRSEDEHAFIAYGGPLAGTAASLGCAAIGLITGQPIWLALAYTGFYLNLFNLVPIQPLDGGRVTAGFSPRAWMLGGVMIAGMFLVTQAFQFLLIAFLAFMAYRRSRGAPAMAPMTDEQKSNWTIRYFGLCFFLGAAIFFTHGMLHPAAIE